VGGTGRILVIGAGGKVGRLVVAGLADAGAPVRALLRSDPPATLPRGVEVAIGDLTDPASLEAALGEVDAVFLTWALGGTEHSATVIGAIARHARRVVYLSTAAIRDELAVQEHPLSAMHAENERLLRASVAGWTVLRATKFATNTVEWAPAMRGDGVVELPYPAAGRSPIHQRDVAAVAARTLVDDDQVGAVHTLTGPESLTEGDQVRIIGEVIGRAVECRTVDPATVRARMLAEGVAAELADAALAYWKRLVTVPEPVTATVEQLTGSPPRSFRAWVEEHADWFR
jgi:uncharacterized protein YbjT (DUF2867 family)